MAKYRDKSKCKPQAEIIQHKGGEGIERNIVQKLQFALKEKYIEKC